MRGPAQGLLSAAQTGSFRACKRAKELVPAELLGSSSGMPKEVLLSRLAKRLHDDLGVAEDFARWAVESWALVFGVVTAKDSRIPFKCSGCGASVSAASRLAGQTVQCPKCKATVRIPALHQETSVDRVTTVSARESASKQDIAHVMQLLRLGSASLYPDGGVYDYVRAAKQDRLMSWKAAAEEGVPEAQVLFGCALVWCTRRSRTGCQMVSQGCGPRK